MSKFRVPEGPSFNSNHPCNIRPLARNWSVTLDHIWEDRLDPMNHHPFSPHFATVLWDTTCFRVQKPSDWTFGRYVVNGHYDFPCFLVLTGITFTGHLVYASGLMRSTTYDASMYHSSQKSCCVLSDFVAWLLLRSAISQDAVCLAASYPSDDMQF